MVTCFGYLFEGLLLALVTCFGYLFDGFVVAVRLGSLFLQLLQDRQGVDSSRQ
jgi:hypothetical protein